MFNRLVSLILASFFEGEGNKARIDSRRMYNAAHPLNARERQLRIEWEAGRFN